MCSLLHNNSQLRGLVEITTQNIQITYKILKKLPNHEYNNII